MDRHRREVLFGSMSAVACTALSGKALGQESKDAEVTSTIKDGEQNILLSNPQTLTAGTSEIKVFKDWDPSSSHWYMPNKIETFTL